MEMTGAWKAYRDSTTNKIKVSLDGVGLPDFWVTITNPSVYSPVELNEWLQRVNRETRERLNTLIETFNTTKTELQKQVVDGSISQEDLEERLSDLEYQEPTIMLATERDLIEEWNLTDPETGELMPTPKADYRVLWRIPIGVQKYLHEKLNSFIMGEETVPKASETS